MLDPDRSRTCDHGYRTTTMPAEGGEGEGWLIDVVVDCPRCPKAMVVGIPYLPGTPPPQPGDRKRTVAEIAADVDRRRAMESAVRPLPDVCLECGGPRGPESNSTVAVAGLGWRHASGSPACRPPSHRTSSPAAAPPPPPEEPRAEERSVTPPKQPTAPEEPTACPTCGRPVVGGVPYDLPAIRQALVDALSAVDTLSAGGSQEQEALKELDEPA